MRVLAPIDLGAALVARTSHVAIAGPYHRNARGNRASLAAFLGPADRAAGIAHAVATDALLWCPGALGDRPPPAGSIGAGALPPGLRGVPLPGGATLFAPDRRGLPLPDRAGRP